jgi:sec-independent protein translocase protein TatC
VALNLVGVLSYEVLRGARRWIFFLTIVFAAFVTPTQDPFTMLLMAGPMIVLFELAIQVARFVDRRRAKRDAVEHFHALSDDEASPLDAAPSQLDAPPYDDLRREDDAAPLDDPARSRH